MSLIRAKERRRNTTIQIDVRDYLDDFDELPVLDEYDCQWMRDEIDSARRCLTKATPDIQEALLRIERVLPMLTKAAK